MAEVDEHIAVEDDFLREVLDLLEERENLQEELSEEKLEKFRTYKNLILDN